MSPDEITGCCTYASSAPACRIGGRAATSADADRAAAASAADGSLGLAVAGPATIAATAAVAVAVAKATASGVRRFTRTLLLRPRGWRAGSTEDARDR